MTLTVLFRAPTLAALPNTGGACPAGAQLSPRSRRTPARYGVLLDKSLDARRLWAFHSIRSATTRRDANPDLRGGCCARIPTSLSPGLRLHARGRRPAANAC